MRGGLLRIPGLRLSGPGSPEIAATERAFRCAGWADTDAVRTSLPQFYESLKDKLRTPEQVRSHTSGSVALAVPHPRAWPTLRSGIALPLRNKAASR